MCCLRVDTDVILAQLFAASKYPVSYTMEDIKKYFNFLSQKFPVYLTTNLCEDLVVSCTEEYPELYVLSNNGKEIVVKSGNFYPNLDYFMTMFQEGNKNYMKIVTESYLEGNE